MPFNPFTNRDTPVLYDGYVGTCIVTQLARPYRTKRRELWLLYHRATKRLLGTS